MCQLNKGGHIMTTKEYDAYCRCYSGGAASIVGDWLANVECECSDDGYEIEGFDMDELLDEKACKELMCM